MTTNIGVHRTHCCVRHGCKYGNQTCPVTLGQAPQDSPCDRCAEQPEWVPQSGSSAFLAMTREQRKDYRLALASALEVVRRQRCGYSSPITPDARCDCKYGLGDQLLQRTGRRVSSEQTGCPELREAINLLLEDD